MLLLEKLAFGDKRATVILWTLSSEVVLRSAIMASKFLAIFADGIALASKALSRSVSACLHATGQESVDLFDKFRVFKLTKHKSTPAFTPSLTLLSPAFASLLHEASNFAHRFSCETPKSALSIAFLKVQQFMLLLSVKTAKVFLIHGAFKVITAGV